ncbi:protein PXR1-like [Miscanthus floridulus]|uniref:protein PXR1-like n=1 Tax=Miscanthus floridulus TaxID=154761 RepID=UPI003459245F
MAEQLEQPLEPPQILDIKSSDESKGNISPDEKSDSNKNDEQRLARLKKNKLKAGRRNIVKQRKQIWNKYKAKLTEYNRKKAEREATKSTKRERIEELTKELHTLTNNGKSEEDQKKEVGGPENNPVRKFHKSHKENNHPKSQFFKD